MIKSTLYKNNRVKLTVIYNLNKVLSYSFKQLHTIYEYTNRMKIKQCFEHL